MNGATTRHQASAVGHHVLSALLLAICKTAGMRGGDTPWHLGSYLFKQLQEDCQSPHVRLISSLTRQETLNYYLVTTHRKLVLGKVDLCILMHQASPLRQLLLVFDIAPTVYYHNVGESPKRGSSPRTDFPYCSQ